MVSTGDTEISLHIRSPRFQAYGGGEGGYSGVRTENTQSAKICLNFNLGGGGGGLGYCGVRTENTQRAKIYINFNLGGGGLSDLKFQRGALWRIWTPILLFVVTVHKPACASQIVSHVCGD